MIRQGEWLKWLALALLALLAAATLWAVYTKAAAPDRVDQRPLLVARRGADRLRRPVLLGPQLLDPGDQRPTPLVGDQQPVHGLGLVRADPLQRGRHRLQPHEVGLGRSGVPRPVARPRPQRGRCRAGYGIRTRRVRCRRPVGRVALRTRAARRGRGHRAIRHCRRDGCGGRTRSAAEVLARGRTGRAAPSTLRAKRPGASSRFRA